MIQLEQEYLQVLLQTLSACHSLPPFISVVDSLLKSIALYQSVLLCAYTVSA